MKTNPEKFHFLTCSNGELKICINDDVINTIKYVKLLVAIINSIFNFNTHSNAMCKKLVQKFFALFRITPFMGCRRGGTQWMHFLCLNLAISL